MAGVALAKGTQRRPNLPQSSQEFQSFISELFGENDRSAAIVGVAILDEYLFRLIAKVLIDDKKAVSEMLGPKNPLAPFGSLAARTKAAFDLGLLSKDEQHDLEALRAIRNRFAHELFDCSFEDPWIEEKCAALRIPIKYRELGEEIDLESKVLQSSKGSFGFTVNALVAALQHRIREVEHRASPVDFYDEFLERFRNDQGKET